ncbi:unnamed protein product [Lactuca saligna]|uniref:MULE transposase domain-containing protein n=1 Tax=Lactuca saligna TaxID=75948 RepID=A0AA36EJM5_LACSI|nr:unnamed protein product [Lactuca saligna]
MHSRRVSQCLILQFEALISLVKYGGVERYVYGNKKLMIMRVVIFIYGVWSSRRSIDGMVDDKDIPGGQQNEQAHLDEDDEDVGVEYRVHDPNVDWREMMPRLGDYCESTDQLRNYHFGSIVTSNWLAKHYLKDAIIKPKITLLEMQEDVLQRLSNLDTTFLVGVESNLGCNYLKSLYVGFKDFRGCRRVIGLDGSFLMGQVKGEILTSIGRDSNNHVYLIACAVVNVENMDNWTWFIENLVADLDLGAGNGLVIILDQQKVPTTYIIGPAILRRDAAHPPVSKSGDQDGGHAITPMKRTKMMARRGGKTKVFGSRNKTPKKTPNGKQHKSQAKDDVSLTCDEDFNDLFTHTPNGTQPMSQEN